MTTEQTPLRELALAATAGPWKQLENEVIGTFDTHPRFVADADYEADAAFIAACDPQTILALLDRAEARAEQQAAEADFLSEVKGAAIREARAEQRKALLALAASWEGDAEFFEDGDETHTKPRVVLRKRKASPREMSAGVARECAAQLRAALTEGTP